MAGNRVNICSSDHNLPLQQPSYKISLSLIFNKFQFMKLYLFLFLNIFNVFFLASCGGPKNEKTNEPTKKIKEIKNENKAAIKLDPEKDFIEIISKGKTPEAAEFIKKAVKDSAQIAAKTVLEDILLHFNETEIEDDLMVFGLESDLNKKLSLELISDNAVLYLADIKIDIPSKLVFKAVKLNNLKAGKYYFILRDETGNELIKKIKISHRNS